MKVVDIAGISKISFESAKRVAEKIAEVMGVKIFAEWDEARENGFRNISDIESWLRDIERQAKLKIAIADFFFWAK